MSSHTWAKSVTGMRAIYDNCPIGVSSLNSNISECQKLLDFSASHNVRTCCFKA